MSAIERLTLPTPLFIAISDLVSMLYIPSEAEIWEAVPPEAYYWGTYGVVISRAPLITL